MAIKVKLLRPLDGRPAGDIAEYPEADAKRLEGYGAVQIIKEKSAPDPQNKMAPPPLNKAVTTRQKKGN